MSNLSGADWWHENQAKYPNSQSLDDLEPNFRAKVNAFLHNLYSAGAQVKISSTLRSPIRAYLMHYSWFIAKGLIAPEQVPMREDCDIFWIHPSLEKSRQAAQEMVELFGMAFMAVLESRHTTGQAIDMDIQWSGTMQVLDGSGKYVLVDSSIPAKDNTVLHQVGASFGVFKLRSDPPHWSCDGH